VKAVDGISFDIREGEILGLVGESGSGKTMTALSLMRLVPTPPAKIIDGNVDLNGVDLMKLQEEEMRMVRGSKISMIFQDPLTSLNPLMRTGSQISETLRIHHLMDKKSAAAEAIRILNLVGIPEAKARASQYPFELSGGMRQRVMIAIAIAAQPKLIIADEPTTNLDATIQAQILSMLRRIREEQGTSVLLITHNLGIVAWVCDTVAVMYAGKIVEIGPTRSVLRNPAHPYSRALLRSVPQVNAPRGPLEAIPGDVPELVSLPTACHFSPRCPHAKSVCREKDPPAFEIEGDHLANCFMYDKEWENVA